MPDPNLDPDQDPDRIPPTAAELREQDLYERYRRRFKEYPPDFGVPESQRPAFLKAVAAALKSGQAIRLNIPPDVEA